MPATAAQTQTLIDQASCYLCLPGISQTNAIYFVLLGLISQSTPPTAQALIDQASCYLCLPGVSQADAINFVLLGLISQAIASGAQLSHGSGPPVDPPALPLLDALYLDNDEGSASYGTKWSWDVDNAVWI